MSVEVKPAVLIEKQKFCKNCICPRTNILKSCAFNHTKLLSHRNCINQPILGRCLSLERKHDAPKQLQLSLGFCRMLRSKGNVMCKSLNWVKHFTPFLFSPYHAEGSESFKSQEQSICGYGHGNEMFHR